MSPASENQYAERTAKLVPGLTDLHKMTALLLAERAPENAEVLVLGAGGGMELKAIAQMHPSWTFLGVDPSAEMLDLARANLGSITEKVEFCEGYIADAPDRLFDAATCLLTLHFLAEEERRQTLAQIHQRLKPGAPLVVAHHSFPREPEAAIKWLKRYAAFANASGVPSEQANGAIAAISEKLPYLPPEQDEALLREIGFSEVELFYAGFTFRGWVCYKVL